MPAVTVGVALGPHAPFIIAAYAVTAVVIALLIAWVMLDHRAQRRAAADLDARGVRRRSQRMAATTTTPEATA